jgi:hypothetical protein
VHFASGSSVIKNSTSAQTVVSPFRVVSELFAGPPSDLRIEAGEWHAFAATQANALMIGEPQAVMRALTFAWMSLRQPVVWCEDSRLTLPTGSVGTYIIWRVNELTIPDQQHLLHWLDRAEPTRVLARSSRPIFPLVQAGAFADTLYHRLNPVLMLVPDLDLRPAS